MKKLLFFMMLAATSCTAPKRIQVSGINYLRVVSVDKLPNGRAITLENTKGTYIVFSDTVKVNDFIPVSWVQFKKRN